MTRTSLRRKLSALAVVASASALSPSAHALNFVFTDVGTTPMTAIQLAAFQAAGNYWASQLSDPVTIYMNISFAPLGPNILGSTGSNFTTITYANMRTRLTADATSANDASSVAALQAGPALSFFATQGDLSVRFDNDGSVNNTLLGITTANAKAIGLNPGTSVATPDANIQFSSNFAFDYDRSNGISPGTYDFLTVAEHEIGHALGFVSGVDDIDFCAGPNNQCGLPNTPDRFENDWWYEPLDLFRFSAPGVMDVRVGGSPYFSVNGGATSLATFSTGSSANGGNGSQASHFGTNVQRLMRPFVGAGQSYDADAVDLAAFDVIGWNLAAVPEPSTWLLMALGLVAVGRKSLKRASAGPCRFRPPLAATATATAGRTWLF
jgi:PEP-CTERM motif